MSTKLSKEYIISYLNEIKDILDTDKFNATTDFIFYDYREKNKNFLLKHRTSISKLPNFIKNLNIENYSDCILDDKDDGSSPYLLVFGINIDNTEVYIKFKILYLSRRKILCVSFHDAEFKMKYPFKEEVN